MTTILDIKTFTDQEILDELEVRLAGRYLPDSNQTDLLDLVEPVITPYSIIRKMIEQEWKEDPRVGYSDPRIDKMWAYLGMPRFTDDESYCAATVNACLKLAGYETSEAMAASRSLESYGKSMSVTDALEGDIVNFRRVDSNWQGHVGFLVSVEEEGVIVAGGNQSNKMCLKEFSFYSDKLMVQGFRRISDINKVRPPDLKTLKEWGLL